MEKDNSKVDCKIHGLSTSLNLVNTDTNYNKFVCFQCWAEKTTEGLEDFAPVETDEKI